MARLAATSMALASRRASSCSPTCLLPEAESKVPQPVHQPYPNVNTVNKRSQHMRTVTALAVVLALGLAATAQAELLKGDPRVCAQSTPGGQTKHAFYCAQYAAVATVKAKMAARENVARWFYPVLCDRVAGSLLRWRCSLVKGGPYATATVRFAKTASGWTRAVTVVMAP